MLKIGCHLSSAKGYLAMGKEAMIHGKMCMGEGTGAAALFPLLDMAATIYNTMSTFEDIHMDQYEHLE